ncbi:hypothetical protein HRI_003326800 [Hibiscus trionum]|uniref:Uncharacterized protein n=1 Tax=Hibiscus trionum TaxID=183268 RepID=A0A9W7MFV8_HIBTR|nr:hypothetical protein HRI_003326800 [Hibiscus trionum]
MSKVCFSLFIVLSLLANHSISTDSSEQYAPTASESRIKSASSESDLSVPPSANIPDVVTESNGTLPVENVSTLSNSNEPTDLQTKGEETLIDQELAYSPSVNADPTIETKGSDDNILTSPSPSPSSPRSIDDNSVLDTRDMDGLSRENVPVPLSKADPPAAETKEEGNNVAQENTLAPSSSPPTLSPAYIDTPGFETSDEGSFTQENQSPPPSNTVSQTPEIVPQLNDYSSLPIAAVPAASELDPSIQSTPYDSAPTVFPSNYRAEDEAVEPYEEEEDSWNRANGAVACVLVGACVIGVAGFVYQKRKKDEVRAQVQHEYECLALVKKEGV